MAISKMGWERDVMCPGDMLHLEVKGVSVQWAHWSCWGTQWVLCPASQWADSQLQVTGYMSL